VLPSELAHLLPPFLIPILIAGTMLHTEWRLSRFLETGVLKWVGRISYSLYVWQQIIFLVRPEVAGERTWPAWFAISMIPLCSLASYYLVELPMIRYGRRWIPQRAETIPPAAQSSILCGGPKEA